MKNKIQTGIVTDISLTSYLRQYESKIRHMTFEELVNIVRFSSPKYKHRRSVNLTGKIHYNDHITHKDV